MRCFMRNSHGRKVEGPRSRDLAYQMTKVRCIALSAWLYLCLQLGRTRRSDKLEVFPHKSLDLSTPCEAGNPLTRLSLRSKIDANSGVQKVDSVTWGRVHVAQNSVAESGLEARARHHFYGPHHRNAFERACDESAVGR